MKIKDYIKYGNKSYYEKDDYWGWKVEKKYPIDEFINDNTIEDIINKIGIEKVELVLRKLKIEKIKNNL